MKKKYLFAIVSITALLSLLSPLKAFAVIADLEGTVARQQSAAKIEVIGTVKTSEYVYSADEVIDKDKVSYSVKITQVVKGENIFVGQLVHQLHLCNRASEMYQDNIGQQLCTDMSPKVGDVEHIYMNFVDNKYDQAIIYEDPIIAVTDDVSCSTMDENGCVQQAPFYKQSSFYIQLAITVGIICTVVAIIVIIVKKNKSKSKKSVK